MCVHSKRNARILVCGFFLFLLFFFPAHGGIVHAQDLTPQKVTATLHTQRYNMECEGSPIDFYLEAWNVGSAGGPQYGDAVLKINYYTCDSMNGPGTELKTTILTSSFSGGPTGTGVFNVPTYTDGRPQTSTYHHWILEFDKTVVHVGRKKDPTSWYTLTIDNPEVFSASAQPQQQAAPEIGKDCTPSVGGLTGLKPGDTLSPSVEFFDPDGKPVAPLSAVWYINGKETYSTTWNGNYTALQLQYTCPDNSAHTKDFEIQAYVEEPAPPPPAAPAQAAPPADAQAPDVPAPDAQAPADQPPDSQPPAPAVQPPDSSAPANPPVPPSLPPPNPVAVGVGLIMGIAGVAGVAVTVGVATGAPAVVKPPVTAPPAQPPTPAPVNTQPQPVSSPEPAPSQPADSPPAQTPSPIDNPTSPDAPAEPQPTPEQNAQWHAQINNEIDRLTAKYDRLEREEKALRRILKRNLIKITIKKIFDVMNWITLDPQQLVKNTIDQITPDDYKLIERLFQKHDTSKDTDIVVDMNNRIETIEKERREIAKEVVRLRNSLEKN